MIHLTPLSGHLFKNPTAPKLFIIAIYLYHSYSNEALTETFMMISN